MDYVQRVRAARGSLNLSLTDFAKRIGVGRSTLVRIERGDREPDEAEYSAMAKATGLPLEFFTVPDLHVALAGAPPADGDLKEIQTAITELRAAVTALSSDSLRHTRELRELRGTDHRRERPGGNG